MKIDLGKATILVKDEDLKEAVFEIAPESLKMQAALSLLNHRIGRPYGSKNKVVEEDVDEMEISGKKFSRWTAKEDNFLRDNYEEMSAKECAKELGRPVGSTTQRIKTLGLRKNRIGLKRKIR